MTDLDFADRVDRVSPSATLAISNKASELEAEGVDVVDLSVGEPDFDTPENVKDAAKEALDAGHTGYTPSQGIPELREAVTEKLHGDGLDQYGPENVMVTPGAKQALFEVFQTLIDDGDEVVLLDPAWVSYEAMVKIAGGSLKRVDTSQYDFRLEDALGDLNGVVTEDTELLVLNSPGNPHGTVYGETALQGVRDLASEYDVTVIADEIYDEITYDGVTPTSIGTLEGMQDRTITVNGFSKSYAMTGWRLGYFAGPEELVSQAGKVHGHSVSCAVNFVQHAGIEAIRNTEETVEEMVAAFEERRDLLLDLFRDRDVNVATPQGAFYMMPEVGDCEALRASERASGDQPRADDQAWCEEAIEEAHVATVPGSAFGTPGYARISYAASTEELREAVDRLDEADLL
ncbi:pyridoxal phosphate-dependent aminotransferase [Halobacteriales archaeon Cl-PHB]